MVKFEFGNRKPIDPSTIQCGDVVAFEWNDDYNGKKKGVIWLVDSTWFNAAYNLFRDADDEGGVWWTDQVPDNIIFYQPTREEYQLASEKFRPQDSHLDEPFNMPFSFEGEPSLDELFETIKTKIKNHDEAQRENIDRLRTETIKQSEEAERLFHENTEKEMEFNAKLKAAEKRIKELEETIIQLKEMPTEDAFVKKFVKETKHFYKHDRKKADAIRQIMIKVGRADADADIDAWIEGKEKPLVTIEKAGDVIADGGKKIVRNVNKTTDND